MTQIILTRHGHVDWILPERFRGRADLALTDRGVEQARLTSRRIQALGAVSAVYSSPLRRCVLTAQTVAAPFGLDVEPIDDLNDLHYGEWHGLTADEARERWPKEIELWHRVPHLARIPGGESLQELQTRAARALRAIIDRHPDDTMVLVGHDSINRIILLHALELSLARYWHLTQSPCAISRIIAATDGFFVRSVNETCHLDAAEADNCAATSQRRETTRTRASQVAPGA